MARIISILLGLGVVVFLLRPVGDAWWSGQETQAPEASQTAQAPAPAQKVPSAEPQAPRLPAKQVFSATAPEQPPAKPAPERTDAKRLAATEPNTQGILSQQTETKLYRRVTVRDGGSLQADGIVIKLAGISARESNATCKDERGKTWHCGAAAKAALAKLIRSRAVSCTLPQSGEHNTVVARCSVADTDLSAWLVRQGWAEPNDATESELAAAAEAARAEKIGLWREGD